MVREGRIIIRDANTDPDFGSNYYVKALEVGAIVAQVSTGTTVTVDAGHGFANGDKLLVLSTFPAKTSYRAVSGVGATSFTVDSNLDVAIGDVLINLGADTGGVAGPNFDGNGLTVYTDMDYGSQATSGGLLNVVQSDSNGRYRYFYNNIPIWELVLSSLTTPFTAYLDTGLSGVGGAASSTDNAVARWDGSTGQTLQNSVVIIADAVGGSADVTGVRDLTVNNNLTVVSDAAVGDDLTVTGTSILADVTTSGTVTMAANATVGTTLIVTSTLTAQADASVGTDLTVTDDLSVGDVFTVGGTATVSGHFMRSAAAAVTAAASPNNTQAGGTALTKDINNVATCATAGNAVVMPAAVAGMMVSVFNNGVASCAIWPAVGDNLGLGLNVQNTLASASNVTYASYDTTNWEII